MTEISGPKQSDIQPQTPDAGPSAPVANKPTIEIAGRYQSADSLRAQAAGAKPDTTGESIVLPNQPNMTGAELSQQAQDQRVLTPEEKQEQVEALLDQLPPAVLEAKNPQELEEKIIEAQVAHTGEPPAVAKKRFDTIKAIIAGVGGDVSQWFDTGIQSSNAFAEIMRMLFDRNYFGRNVEGSSGAKSETGESLKTKGDFIDRISHKPKLFGEALKKAYYETDGLKDKGLKLNELQLQNLIDTGSLTDLKQICVELVNYLTENSGQKANRWKLFSEVFGKHVFDNDKAKLADDVKDFLIEDLVKDDLFFRFFGQANQAQPDSAAQTPIAV